MQDSLSNNFTGNENSTNMESNTENMPINTLNSNQNEFGQLRFSSV